MTLSVNESAVVLHWCELFQACRNEFSIGAVSQGRGQGRFIFTIHKSGASEASGAPNGARSRELLKGPWRGSRGQRPRKILVFCRLQKAQKGSPGNIVFLRSSTYIWILEQKCFS